MKFFNNTKHVAVVDIEGHDPINRIAESIKKQTGWEVDVCGITHTSGIKVRVGSSGTYFVYVGDSVIWNGQEPIQSAVLDFVASTVEKVE